MLDLSNFLKWEYWSEGFSGSNALYYTPSLAINEPNFGLLLWIPIVFVLLGSVLNIYKVWADDRNPIKLKASFISSNLITLGILGLSYFLSRMLNFRFLSSRFVMLLLVGYFVIFSYYVLRYFILFFPIEWKYYLKNKNSR
jgi:hypothetical protein